MSATPNYQGMFLRGYGSQVSTHWGTVTHSSDGLGAMQGDAIRNITGSIRAIFTTDSRSADSAFYLSSDVSMGVNNSGDQSDRNVAYTFDASRVVPTANENRPINKAVRYLIKAKS